MRGSRPPPKRELCAPPEKSAHMHGGQKRRVPSARPKFAALVQIEIDRCRQEFGCLSTRPCASSLSHPKRTCVPGASAEVWDQSVVLTTTNWLSASMT